MQTLAQIIAVDASVKTNTEKALTEVYHLIQRTEPLSGIARTYRPKDDDGETLPPESKRVQATVQNAIVKAQLVLADLFDVTATKDFANCQAVADVIVGGTVLLRDVPATYLLFLEKKLVDVRTFVSKLPVLDASETWHFDEAQGCYATEAVETARSKKIPRNHVKAIATDKHPAQVELYYEDVTVGYWKTVKFSGALTQVRVSEMLARVEALQKAVKFAREKANTVEAPAQHVGDTVLSFVFGK